jgi:hypothetical protein
MFGHDKFTDKSLTEDSASAAPSVKLKAPVKSLKEIKKA